MFRKSFYPLFCLILASCGRPATDRSDLNSVEVFSPSLPDQINASKYFKFIDKAHRVDAPKESDYVTVGNLKFTKFRSPRFEVSNQDFESFYEGLGQPKMLGSEAKKIYSYLSARDAAFIRVNDDTFLFINAILEKSNAPVIQPSTHVWVMGQIKVTGSRFQVEQIDPDIWREEVSWLATILTGHTWTARKTILAPFEDHYLRTFLPQQDGWPTFMRDLP